MQSLDQKNTFRIRKNSSHPLSRNSIHFLKKEREPCDGTVQINVLFLVDSDGAKSNMESGIGA